MVKYVKNMCNCKIIRKIHISKYEANRVGFGLIFGIVVLFIATLLGVRNSYKFR